MENIFSLIIFCFVTSFSPGPNNIMLMTSGVNYGVYRSVPHFLGVAIGFPLMIIAIGLGLGQVFRKYPDIYLLIKMFGILYLLFLSWKIAFASMPETGKNLNNPLTFFQATLFQWVNPKAWVIAIGAIATFTTSTNIQTQVLLIAIGYFMVGGLSVFAWLFLGAALKSAFRNKKRLKMFNFTMAALLVLSIVPMVLVEIGSVI